MTTPRTLTDAEIAAIRARVEAATKGPWSLHMHGDALENDVAHISGPHGCAFIMVHAGAENVSNGHYVTRDEARSIAPLIAHSRTDIPALLAALTDARERAERLRKALDRAADMLSAVAGDIEDGYALIALRGKYVTAILRARDDAHAALSDPTREEDSHV